MVIPRYVLLGALLAFWPSLSQAKNLYGMAGCGLGSLVIGANGGQVSAATTNESFSSQGFGISSGTSNCIEPGKAAAAQAQQRFMDENYATLSKEMAQGDGAALRALSDTFGCRQNAYPIFAKQLRQSYDKIFAAPGAIAALNVVHEEVKGNAELHGQCAYII